MTKLILARHGETLWHAENRYAGTSDVGLTPRGLAQAEALGRWASTHPVDSVVTSDLSRAILTAAPACLALQLEPLVEPRLREVFFGGGEGLTASEMEQEFPEALAAFRREPATTPLPGGESGLDALERAVPALRDIVHRTPEGTVLVVMHSTLMRLALCRLLGIDPDLYRAKFPSVRNVALTTVELGEHGACALLGYNVPIEGA